MPSRIAMISTYPPTQCGIATFARSMSNAMKNFGQQVDLIRISGNGSAKAVHPASKNHFGADGLLENVGTLNNYDAVIIQHEFGIYGGPDGDEVLEILNGIKVPVVSVIHTVITTPTNGQRRVMQGLLDRSDASVALSHSAADAISKNYVVDDSRLKVIPHGSPDYGQFSRPIGFNLRPRILTWGLLSEGKGIEWGITALALLQDVDPLPDYYIVGQTHPKVVERDGFAYREKLEKLAIDLNVRERIHFIDAYLDTEELNRVINSADFYLIPYDNDVQVTSGVLVEAIAAGGPVIATRFPHAVELLGDGTGALVNQKDPESIASAMRLMIRNSAERARMRELTVRKGPNFHWSQIGISMNSLSHSLTRRRNQFPSIDGIYFAELQRESA